MSLISKAIRYLGKKGIIGALDVESIVQHQADKVQEYQTPVYDWKTPMQLIAGASHAVLDGSADAVDRLIPGQFLDDIVTFPLRKADFGIQVGTRILDPISQKTGRYIGTSIGNVFVKKKNSKPQPKTGGKDPNYGIEQENVPQKETVPGKEKPQNTTEIPKTKQG